MTEKKSKEERRLDVLSAAIKLFSQKGFYATTIPDIAIEVGMSTGNIYNYFASKEDLAKCSIRFCTNILAERLRHVNDMNISMKSKIYRFTLDYFEVVDKSPEVIEFFLRVYLANREVFSKKCDNGYECAFEFIEEIKRFLNQGINSKEFKDEEFHIAFSMIMGPLGCFTFLTGENVLENSAINYADNIAEDIYRALKRDSKE